jgi:hypothetical protein
MNITTIHENSNEIRTNQKVAVLLPISVALIGLIYIFIKKKYCTKNKYEETTMNPTSPVVSEMI